MLYVFIRGSRVHCAGGGGGTRGEVIAAKGEAESTIPFASTIRGAYEDRSDRQQDDGPPPHPHTRVGGVWGGWGLGGGGVGVGVG